MFLLNFFSLLDIWFQVRRQFNDSGQSLVAFQARQGARASTHAFLCRDIFGDGSHSSKSFHDTSTQPEQNFPTSGNPSIQSSPRLLQWACPSISFVISVFFSPDQHEHDWKGLTAQVIAFNVSNHSFPGQTQIFRKQESRLDKKKV